MEDRVVGVARHFSKKLCDPLRFGLERDVVHKGRVKIYLVKDLEAGRILNNGRIPRDGVDEPWLASNIAGVEDCLPVIFNHYRILVSWSISACDAGVIQNMTAPGQ